MVGLCKQFLSDISFVMTFLDFIMFVLNAMLRHTSYIVGSSGVFLVCTDISCWDVESCLDILRFHHVFVGCHTGA